MNSDLVIHHKKFTTQKPQRMSLAKHHRNRTQICLKQKIKKKILGLLVGHSAHTAHAWHTTHAAAHSSWGHRGHFAAAFDAD